MSYISKTVSVSGDEKTFVKIFIQQLTAADNRITCDTDVDAEFADDSKKPEFVFNIGNLAKIVLTRPELVFPAGGYYTDFYINGVKYEVKDGVRFMSGDLSKDEVAVRTIKFTVVSNDKVLYIALGEYNAAMPSSAKCSLMCVTDGSFMAAAVSTSNADVVSGDFHCTDSVNQNIIVKFTDRFNYAVTGGNLEIMQNKVLLNGDTKFYEISDLYDCSTFTSLLEVGIDKKQYFSLNEHTLMPI